MTAATATPSNTTARRATERVTDRVFVPAAFAGRLAQMPARTTAPAARAAWLAGQLAELADPAVVATAHGMEALRLAVQVQRELAALSTLDTARPGPGDG